MDCNKNPKSCKLIIIFGLYLHILLLCAVFEIDYPSRPITNGLNLTEPTTDQPDAKRLVLFLADGLRAEAIFGSNSYRVPFLNDIMLNRGSWGRAYVRPPTLERSGHIAIISGAFNRFLAFDASDIVAVYYGFRTSALEFYSSSLIWLDEYVDLPQNVATRAYEDPITTIYKSWTRQPIGIDSLLNQSAKTHCWGHLDAANLFNSDNLTHVNVTTHSLDTGKPYNKWIVEEVGNFIKNMSTRQKFVETQRVYLIHMPVIDMAGYPIKPGSREFREYITNLDEDVESIAVMFKTKFVDDQTAYVFTSAHGMTDWGMHGGDSRFETETPFIAWGAGIIQNSKPVDLNQTDIVPLLAALIGVPIPKNSLGVLPSDYLGMLDDYLVSDVAVNALQLSKIFLKKMEQLKSTNILFDPYNDLDQLKIEDIFLDFQMLYVMKQYSVILNNTKIFVDELIRGIDYYQSYYRGLLFFSIFIALLEWILFLLLYTLGFVPLKKSYLENYLLLFVAYIPVYFCYVHELVLSYYLYICLPFILFAVLYPYLRMFCMHFLSFIMKWNFNFTVYVLTIELIALAFFKKVVLSFLLIFIGLSPNLPGSFGNFASKKEKIIWFSLCLSIAMFTSLPRPLQPIISFPLFIYGSFIWIYLLCQWEDYLNDRNFVRETEFYFTIFPIQKLCFMVGAIYQTVLKLGYGHYATPVKGLSWFLSILPIILIPFSNTFVLFRLAAIVFGVAPFYLLTSTGDELFFLVVYVATLLQWLVIETKTFYENDDIAISLQVGFDRDHDQQIIVPDKMRKILFQFVFLLAGFYGAGNVTNVLFNPEWTASFLTKPHPAMLTFLVISKMIVPIFITCCIFQGINVLTKDNHLQMFCCNLFVFEAVLVQVIFFVNTKVSTLQFFVINAFVLTMLFLHFIVNNVTTFRYFITAGKVSIYKIDL